MGKKKAKKQVIGYRYYMGAHLALCQGPVDQVLALKLGDREFWSGSSTGGRINVNLPELYGGERREGGISGELDLLMGSDAQTANDYLQTAMAGGGVLPAFRGVVSLVLRKMYIAANNPVLKPIAARIKRIDSGWDNTWFGYKTAGDGMNPAAIIYQCLTDRRWGMGWPESGIDYDSFATAGSALGYEGFGLNLIFDRQRPVEDFIRLVLDHIGGVLRLDANGRFQLVLARATTSYALQSKRRFGPHNVVALESLERPAWQDTANEVTVRYTDAATWKTKTVTVHNLANIQAQGGVVNHTVDYPGITSDTLAARVALRDLAAISVPLARITLRVDARPQLRAVMYHGQWSYDELSQRGELPMPGDVIVLSWPDLGVDSMVLRVGSVELADASDHIVRLVCVEDVFSLSHNVLTAQNTAQWTAPVTTPVAPTYSLAIEAAYWDVARNNGPGDLATFDAADTWITALAARANTAQVEWRYMTGPDSVSAADRGPAGYAPLGYLAASMAAGAADVEIGLNSPVDLAAFANCEYAWIVSAAGTPLEAVGIVAMNTTTTTVTVMRGVLDTVPVLCAAGSRIIGVSPDSGIDPTVRAMGETIKSWIKPVTATAQGNTAAPTHGASTVLAGRFGRPYPPGNVKFNGTAYPVVVAGDLTIIWARRNRIDQTASLIRQTDADITPETGQTVTLRIKNSAGAVVRTYSGLLGTSQSWDIATAAADAGILGGTITVEIEADRDGLTSWKKHAITLERAGWGLRYGQYYGGV